MKKKYTLFLLSQLFGFFSNAQITLTQSVDPITINVPGAACWANLEGTYNDNSFYRVYNLSDFGVTGDFQISSVEYGQGTADGGQFLVSIR